MATKEKYVALMNPRAKKEVMTWTTAVVALYVSKFYKYKVNCIVNF